MLCQLHIWKAVNQLILLTSRDENANQDNTSRVEKIGWGIDTNRVKYLGGGGGYGRNKSDSNYIDIEGGVDHGEYDLFEWYCPILMTILSDLSLQTVYTDCMHQNDGSNIQGDIVDDVAWQCWCR